MYQTHAYDRRSEPGWPDDPVAVVVAEGTHDVSRLVAALNSGTVEQMDVGQRLVRQLRRHNTGRAALQLLAAHGGPDFTPETPVEQRVRELEGEVAMLADTVVMAACLWFGEITSGSERDYASEVLHETASDLVATYPRLRGGYKGATTPTS